MNFTTNPNPNRKELPMLRQGDILLKRVNEIPEGLKQVPREGGRLVLAHGEVTGHAHVVEGEATFLSGILPADVEEIEQGFLRVEAESALVHDEHDTIKLPPGDYEFTRQREYSPEEIRRVAD